MSLKPNHRAQAGRRRSGRSGESNLQLSTKLTHTIVIEFPVAGDSVVDHHVIVITEAHQGPHILLLLEKDGLLDFVSDELGTSSKPVRVTLFGIISKSFPNG